MSAFEIELVDLRTDISNAVERRKWCTAFFEDVYLEAFPKSDQSESPEVWLPLLEGNAPPPAPILHVIIGRQGPAVVGGVIIEFFRKSRAALVTYIAVAPHIRRQGLAKRLLDDAVRRVTTDNDGQEPLILGEVELPQAQKTLADVQKAKTRLAAISALGGQRIVCDYIQPSLGAGKPPLTDLMLVKFSSTPASGSVPSDDVLKFIDEFFGSLGQQGSKEHDHVARSLRGDRVALEDIC